MQKNGLATFKAIKIWSLAWYVGVGLSILIAWTPVKVSAQLSDEEAMAAADKEIAKFDVRPPKWNSHLDKTLKAWALKRHLWEEHLASTNEIWPKKRISEIDLAIKGKEVWLGVYNRVVAPGEGAFHTHAIVFLDAKTGNILAVVNPEE